MSALESSYQLFTQRHWLTVAQLAAATGKTRRTIQLNCKHGDLRHCHKFDAAPNGGPAILLIDLSHAPEDYRLAYARKNTHDRGEALLQLTDRQRRDAELTAQFLEEVETHIQSVQAAQSVDTSCRRAVVVKEVIAAFIAERKDKRRHLKTPTLRHYYRLRERWLAGGKTLVSLADQRALPGKGVKREFDKQAFDFFCSCYLTENQLTSTDAYRTLQGKALEQGWQIPSLATVMRTLQARVPLARITELRKGETARANKHGAYIERDWSKMAGNEFWVSDHVQFDVLAYDDLPGHVLNKDGSFQVIRMWLTTWMDEASRYIVAKRVHRGPNKYEVMASFVDGVEQHYVPKNIRIDNGKEYRCLRFAGGRDWRTVVEKIEVDELAVRPILRDLRVIPHFTTPYNAKAKIVEPWHHHWLHERLDKKCTGYCGTVPSERPEGLAEVVKRGGLMKWSEILPLVDQFVELYHLSVHSELGKCPAIARQEKLLAKVAADPRALRGLLQDEAVVTIGRNGIRFMDCSYGLGNPDIACRQGERVRVRWDRQKIGTLYVYEPKGVYICDAENNGRVDANARQDDFVAAKKLIIRHDKLAEEMATMMPILSAIDPAEQIALQLKQARHVLAQDGGMPEAPAVPIQPLAFLSDAADRGPLPFRPVRPAADGSKVVPMQVEPGTDSPAAKPESPRLPENLMDLYAAG